jgi:hypothetical protein
MGRELWTRFARVLNPSAATHLHRDVGLAGHPLAAVDQEQPPIGSRTKETPLMSREKDVRDFSTSRATPDRREMLTAAATDVSQLLPGSHQVHVERFDATTGNPSALRSEGAPAESGNFVLRALQHLQVVAPALGLAAGSQPSEFVPDPEVQEASSGAKAVHLQQQYKGIPVFQSAATVRFAPQGQLVDTVGSTFTIDADVPVAPALTASEAVLKAAQYVAQPDSDEESQVDQFGEPMPPAAVDVADFAPEVRAVFAGTPQQSTVLDAGPFEEEITAGLIWFPLGDRLALGWDVTLTMPERAAQYEVIVDAASGEILYCHQLIQYVAAKGNVYRVDPSNPRQTTDFPRPINDYALPAPTSGQGNWRWCHKCQGLYFAGNPGSHCPAGAAHDQTGSGEYFLVHDASSYPGQANWRWCHKCQGLYFAGNPGSHCPAGGAHDQTASGNYSLLQQSPFAPGQHGWRWCHKCQGLFFAHNPGSHCPAGGAHDETGSGDYSLLSAGSGLPAAFPDTWVAVKSCVGNSTNAHLSAAGPTLTGVVQNGVVTFDPADATGDDQKVLNIFYYCCYMHDFSYLLGFREANANFQTDNLGRGGKAGDPVDARSWPGAVTGTANMSRSVDGGSPIMNMGMVTSTNRHTAFDSTVVFHEFTHGITNRLVGGGMNQNSLDSPQSGGMGEGWSDYMACTINDVVVVGNWVVNQPAGIRGFPYDSKFPDGFGKIGTGRYNEVHNIGEIWCATLMELNRRTNKYLALQLVIDALKLSAANPSFLNMRDHILAALENMRLSGKLNTNQRDGAWQTIWSVFAHFGMGPQAASNGAQLTGIVGDLTVGQDNWRWCHKCQGLFFAGNPGSHCPAGAGHDAAGSGNYDIVQQWAAAPGQANWRWCHKCQGLFFAGNPGSHCPVGGAHENVGSGDYKLIFNAWGSSGQDNWRWCHKCQGLYFAGNPGSHCPAGGAHDQAGSGDYSLMSH